MTIEGLDSLLDKLSKLENSKEAIKKGVGKAAKKVQGDAKDLAPVGTTGQLRDSIFTRVEEKDGEIAGIVYSNLPHAVYTEFGTGPVGEESPKDLPPEIASEIKYTQDMWWIHETQIDPELARSYGFIEIDTPNGIFFGTYGRKPAPYMYPALKQNQEMIKEILKASLKMETIIKDD